MKNCDFRPISCFISQTIQDMAIVTNYNNMQSSNGSIYNDLERPLTHISRPRQYSTLNMSAAVQQRHMHTMDTHRFNFE